MKYMTSREPRINNQQMIKEENIKRLFNLISAHPGISRARLGRVTALSPTTISSLISELMQMDLVLETGPAITSRVGRKPITLTINPNGRQLALFSLSRWGIRFGLYNLVLEEIDSGFLAHAADQYGGFTEGTEGMDPDAGADYTALIETLLTQSPHFDPQKLLALCISFPGIYLEEEQAFSWSAMRVSISASEIGRLEERFHAPVFLGNSSMCRAYAEKKGMDAPGNSVQDLIYVNVCDGLGAGIIADGAFLVGQEYSAGEIGHVSVDYKGKRCACGLRGCVEQYVNIDAVIEKARRIMTESGLAVPDPLTLEAVGKLYDQGHPELKKAMDDVADMLFTAIYSTVAITGIKRIVIGGGIEELGEGFLNKLRAFTRENPRNMLARSIHISYADSGISGDCLGIAQFYLDHVFAISNENEASEGWKFSPDLVIA